MIKQHPELQKLLIDSNGDTVWCLLEKMHKRYLRNSLLKYENKTYYKLKAHIDRYGYVIYTLPKPMGLEFFGNKSKKIKAHQLVAATYLDNPFDHIVVHHKDNNHTNNHVNNLEWCLLGENNRESNTDFNPLEVYPDWLKHKALDLMINRGVHYKEVSNRTGILVNTLVEAKRRKTWLRIWETFNDQSQDVDSSESKRDASKDDDMVCS